MSIKVFRFIAGTGLVVTFIMFVACAKSTPVSISPSPTRTQDNVPTKVATDLTSWNGATVLGIPRGTQGQIGDVRIGLSSTRTENYIDKNGQMQHGMVASIALYAKDGPSENKMVYLGQVFQFNGFSFLVNEIRPTNLEPNSPPGASGGGLVSFLCLPVKDLTKVTAAGTTSASGIPIAPTDSKSQPLATTRP